MDLLHRAPRNAAKSLFSLAARESDLCARLFVAFFRTVPAGTEFRLRPVVSLNLRRALRQCAVQCRVHHAVTSFVSRESTQSQVNRSKKLRADSSASSPRPCQKES